MKIKQAALSTALLMCLVSGASQAGLVFYTDQTAFNTAAPGLAVQTFDAAKTTGSLAGSLDTNSDNAFFNKGDILAGLSISADVPPPTPLFPTADNLYIGTAGSSALANAVIEANVNTESLNLGFSSSINAVGLGLVSELDSSDLTITFFDTTNTLLGSTIVKNAPNIGIGAFLGVIGTAGEQIGRININSNTDQFEGVDMIQFGRAPTLPNNVPEPAALSLMGLGLAISLRVMNKRRT